MLHRRPLADRVPAVLHRDGEPPLLSPVSSLYITIYSVVQFTLYYSICSSFLRTSFRNVCFISPVCIFTEPFSQRVN